MADAESLVPVLLTVLTVTSFVKCATALSIFRYGVGLTGGEFGLITLVVAFGLAVATMPEPLVKAGGVRALFGGDASSDLSTAIQSILPSIKERTSPKVLIALQGRKSVHEKGSESSADSMSREFQEVLPAFLVSELTVALSIGCLLLVPFLVIDVAVGHMLALLGMPHMSVMTVALPLKLLLFLTVDGWSLLVQKLLNVS